MLHVDNDLDTSAQSKYQTRQSKTGTHKFISDGTARHSVEKRVAMLRKKEEEAEWVAAEHIA